MAIHPSTPGISAQVLINGRPAPEIDDMDEVQVEHENPMIRKQQASNTISKYIESETNQAFSIKVRVGEPYNMQCSKLEFIVFIDEKEAWRPVCERPRWKENNSLWESEVKGLKEGKGRSCQERGFRFAAIETNDDVLGFNKMKRIAQTMKKLGKIEIRVYRANYGKKGGPTAATSKGFLHANGTEVPEKTLKGMAKSHGTSLTKPEKVPRGSIWRVDKLDGEDQPIVIFKFIYCSNEALKNLHVVDRTPSPSPSPSRSPSREASPTPSELQEVRRLRRKNATKVKIEHVDRKRGRPGAKDSGRGRSIKRRKGGKAAVIDLTADNEEDDENEGHLFV